MYIIKGVGAFLYSS